MVARRHSHVSDGVKAAARVTVPVRKHIQNVLAALVSSVHKSFWAQPATRTLAPLLRLSERGHAKQTIMHATMKTARLQNVVIIYISVVPPLIVVATLTKQTQHERAAAAPWIQLDSRTIEQHLDGIAVAT